MVFLWVEAPESSLSRFGAEPSAPKQAFRRLDAKWTKRGKSGNLTDWKNGETHGIGENTWFTGTLLPYRMPTAEKAQDDDHLPR